VTKDPDPTAVFIIPAAMPARINVTASNAVMCYSPGLEPDSVSCEG
jgi:hypothetical protein